MKQVIYAVGDIHGRADLLLDLHEDIRAFHTFMHQGSAAHLVYLGDYIDHGPDSLLVIDRLMAGLPGFETTCLLGNHEEMLLDCLETDDAQKWDLWRSNGGDASLASLGLDPPTTTPHSNQLRDALEPKRISWLKSLKLYLKLGNYIFVHAGIDPGIALQHQKRKDLLWIRSRFLESEDDHGAIVVHGHTPEATPIVKPNRIGVDTGAHFSGVLTAAVLISSDAPFFLRTAP